MTIHDLLSMAALDVMGLLDQTEQEEFERAFRAAPPAVQAQVRREQMRVADIDSVLPAVEPPMGLRAKVIHAVREAMEAVRPRAAAGAFALVPARGVSPAWRAGTIGLAAACVVLVVAFFNVRSESRQLADVGRSNAVLDDMARQFGATFTASLTDPATQFVQFSPDGDADTSVRAVLLLDPEKRVARLFCSDLPGDSSDYDLVVIDADGNQRRAVLSFNAIASTMAREIAEFEGVSADASLALIGPDASGLRRTILRGVRLDKIDNAS